MAHAHHKDDDATNKPEGRKDQLNIAVVGAGVAGLSAAWLLARRHKVTLFEREPRLGGHANTVTVEGPGGPMAIDTGFIVYNELNYPNLTALFDHIGAPTKASDMSFAVSLNGGAAEYSSVDMDGFLNRGRNLFNPRFWSMTHDLLRFYKHAVAEAPPEGAMTLGEYLDKRGYGEAFQRDHILPQAAAIWSASLDDIRAYPACAFIRFFDNHGLLRTKGRPQWRTVAGGSSTYVRRLVEQMGAVVNADRGVARIARGPDGVDVIDGQGRQARFDHVVVAAHANEALAMLETPSPDERALLSPFRYSANEAVLHTDASLMPRKRRLWASWNYVGEGDVVAPCGVTYWMNRLQRLEGRQDYFLSLNPRRTIAESAVLWRGRYDHPLFDPAALAAQRSLWRLQGVSRTWFCGSYFGAGFHEDALQAGLAVAEQLGGVKRPWDVPGQSARITLDAPSSVQAA